MLQVTVYASLLYTRIKNYSFVIQKMRVLLIFVFLFTAKISTSQITTLSGRRISKSEMDSFLRKQMDSLNVKGISIAIINDGKIVYHNAFGIKNVYTQERIDDHTIFEAASVGKPLFAFFVMRLVDKHVLALDTPLYKYLPYKDIAYDDRYKLITARMVLDHTTGFPNWRENDTLKILFAPGTKWSYSGEGYEYLAKVVEELTHTTAKNLDSLFQQEVAIPLQMKHSHYGITTYIARNLAWGHEGDVPVYDPSDKLIFHPAGGLYTEALDYAQFLIGLMNNQILTKTTEDEMLRQQVPLPDDDPKRTKDGITGWSLGFSVKPTAYGTHYQHGGNNWGFTAGFLVNREKKFGYVFFTNANQVNALKDNIQSFLVEGK